MISFLNLVGFTGGKYLCKNAVFSSSQDGCNCSHAFALSCKENLKSQSWIAFVLTHWISLGRRIGILWYDGLDLHVESLRIGLGYGLMIWNGFNFEVIRLDRLSHCARSIAIIVCPKAVIFHLAICLGLLGPRRNVLVLFVHFLDCLSSLWNLISISGSKETSSRSLDSCRFKWKINF